MIIAIKLLVTLILLLLVVAVTHYLGVINRNVANKSAHIIITAIIINLVVMVWLY